MAIKSLNQLSGKVKTRSNNLLDGDRYDQLELSQAEPNPGSPDSDGAILTSLVDGTRSWSTTPQLSGLSFKENSLDSALLGTHVLALEGNPFDATPDNVGLISIQSLLDEVEEFDTLQTVTSRGNVTTESITVAILNSDSATVSGDLKFTQGIFDNNDRRLIIYDSADNVLWGS